MKMNALAVLLLLAVNGCVSAQSPVVTTYAYSRTTAPGIPARPGMNNNPFPVQYHVYVVVRKGARVSLESVCLNGQPYAATLVKVSSPVVVPHETAVPTEGKDTLVPQTSDDVYQVTVEQQKGPACAGRAVELASENEAVVVLKSRGTTIYAPAKTIVALPAAAAP